MKRLMLDYFRRKWWILALGSVFELVFGWTTTSSLDSSISSTFPIFQFQIALFMGAFLLSFDLQRGLARTVAALPLTARQIGRTWWLATVGIPAIVLSALYFSSTGMFCFFHPNTTFPWNALTLTSIFILLWLGTAFTFIFNTTRGFYGNWWQRTCNILFGVLWGGMIGGGFFLFQDLAINSIKGFIFFGVGTLMTAIGWFRAEQFVVGRATFRLVGTQPKNSRGQYRAPSGYGGIPLLISQTVIRSFLIGLAMVVLLPLMMALQGHLKSWHQLIESATGMGSFFPFWMIVFFQLIPVMLQLRFLRTLPVSAAQLAAVMIVIAILPLIAMGGVLAGVAGLASGTPAAVTFLKSFAFTLVPAAMFVFFAVWRGAGIEAYLIMLLTMVGFQTMPMWLEVFFHYKQIPFSLTASITGICVMFAFLLTRRSLLHSSQAYRVQANPFNAGWGMNR